MKTIQLKQFKVLGNTFYSTRGLTKSEAGAVEKYVLELRKDFGGGYPCTDTIIPLNTDEDPTPDKSSTGAAPPA